MTILLKCFPKHIKVICSFQQRYAHNPLSLYQTVQQCLSSEMHLVQRSEGVRNSAQQLGNLSTLLCCRLEWMPPMRWPMIPFIRSSSSSMFWKSQPRNVALRLRRPDKCKNTIPSTFTNIIRYQVHPLIQIISIHENYHRLPFICNVMAAKLGNFGNFQNYNFKESLMFNYGWFCIFPETILTAISSHFNRNTTMEL